MEKRRKKGRIVAGANGYGNQLNQPSFPTHIFVDEDYSLYISDRDNHRVIKWEKDVKEGVVVTGRQGQPEGIIIDHMGQIYVSDGDNDRVMCWLKEILKKGRIIVGGNSERDEGNQFYDPNGLSFDLEGNLYVVDCRNDQIQKF